MTITEVSAKYELSQDTLRYYERVGLLPPVGRGAGGVRDYSEQDCGWVDFIKCMRGAGIPVEVLIDYVQMFQKGDATRAARKALLEEQRGLLRKRIEDLQKTLDRLNYKIDNYDEGFYVAEQNLRKRLSDKKGK